MPAYVGTRRALAALASVAFNPLSLFANGEDGFLYDFSKTDQLFLTSTGQGGVALDSDPIGLALEAHAWAGKTTAALLASQPELVINGGFDSGAGWTESPGVAEISGGVANIIARASASTPAPAQAPAGGAFNANDLIRCVYDIPALTSGGHAMRWVGGPTGVSRVAIGTGLSEFALMTGAVSAIGPRALGTTTASLDNLTMKKVPGNHGLQATTTARAFWRTGGIKRPDGADDNLLTAFKAGAVGNSYAAKITVPASIAASQVLAGLQGATNGRFFIGIGTSGQIIGGVGADSTGVVTEATDRRGATGVIALVANSANWFIYWNGAQVATGAQNGAVDTTVPFRLDALNNNGTAASFSAVDKKFELAVNRALTATEVANLTTLWGTT